MSNETASQSRNRTDTPRTDAKAGFANFDDAMKGGPGNVVPADFARELERELADALSGTDSLTWQYWRDRARAAESNTPSAIRGSVIEECAKVCELDGAKAWDKYKRGEPPYRANPYWEGCSDQADACADHIRALKNAAPQAGEARPSSNGASPEPAGAAPTEDCPRCGATILKDGPPPSSVEDMKAEKDEAYRQRNVLVAALARLYPSGIRKTGIAGWSDDWHGCVYIDLPTGQISYHYHDSQAHLFADLPPYTKPWDGHDKATVEARLLAVVPSATAATRQPAGEVVGHKEMGLALVQWADAGLRPIGTKVYTGMTPTMQAVWEQPIKLLERVARQIEHNPDGDMAVIGNGLCKDIEATLAAMNSSDSGKADK